MRKIPIIIIVAIAGLFVTQAMAGEVSIGAFGLLRSAVDYVTSKVDTAIIILGVASFALNQISQIWPWTKESTMGKLERLIEDAISGATLLKGQVFKEKTGDLTVEQGREVADKALEILKEEAAKERINLEKLLGDDERKRFRIKTIFDRMHRKKESADVEQVAA